jgi:biotin synthase
MIVQEILKNAGNEMDINETQALQLLRIKNGSEEFYSLLSVANDLTRREYNGKGYVSAQIGVNANPCSQNCGFCSMGREHYVLDSRWEKDTESVLAGATLLLQQEVDFLFLMSTANYGLDKFLRIAREVRKLLPSDMIYGANIGDFDDEIAIQLHEAGFTAVYHILRLREGIDTDIDPRRRMNTLEAAHRHGLAICYCVEPIGPEHSYDEIVVEMFRAKRFGVELHGVMRRIPVPGTPFASSALIPAIELAKIAAVTRIATRPKRAFCVHEPNLMALFAGANLLCAEAGANPRDVRSETEKSAGMSVKVVRKMLWEAEYV